MRNRLCSILVVIAVFSLIPAPAILLAQSGPTGPGAATLVGSAELQGRTRGTAAYQVALSVRFYTSGSTTPARTATVTTDNQGTFTLTGVSVGTFDVEVKQAQALSRKAMGIVFIDGSTVQLRFGLLLAGDADNSNQIGFADFSLLRATFGTTTTCAAPNLMAATPPSSTAISCADFDGDGKVDIADFALLRMNFGQAGPLPASPSTTNTRTVTLQDNGKTINLHVGDHLLLNLDEGYRWTSRVADPTILRLLPLASPIAQELYEAIKVGQTTLSAIGDPPCAPLCAMPSRFFQITVVVAPAAA